MSHQHDDDARVVVSSNDIVVLVVSTVSTYVLKICQSPCHRYAIFIHYYWYTRWLLLNLFMTLMVNSIVTSWMRSLPIIPEQPQATRMQPSGVRVPVPQSGVTTPVSESRRNAPQKAALSHPTRILLHTRLGYRLLQTGLRYWLLYTRLEYRHYVHVSHII